MVRDIQRSSLSTTLLVGIIILLSLYYYYNFSFFCFFTSYNRQLNTSRNPRIKQSQQQHQQLKASIKSTYLHKHPNPTMVDAVSHLFPLTTEKDFLGCLSNQAANTDHGIVQSSHIKRGHPIFMGLILLFAIIEGSLTAWLGKWPSVLTPTAPYTNGSRIFPIRQN